MKFKIIFLLSFLLLLPIRASAFCPLCVVATGFGVGIFRWLGVDDTIVGIWVGALAISVAVLLGKMLAKRGINPKISFPLTAIVSFGSLIALLYLGGFARIENKLWGIEKIYLGIIAGSLLIAIVPWINKIFKRMNGGKVIFSYQKIAIALFVLVFSSLIIYLNL